MVVSNIFDFHPYLGKIPILTNIFQMGWNHQPVLFPQKPGVDTDTGNRLCVFWMEVKDPLWSLVWQGTENGTRGAPSNQL